MAVGIYFKSAKNHRSSLYYIQHACLSTLMSLIFRVVTFVGQYSLAAPLSSNLTQ